MVCECRCGRAAAVVLENEQPGQPYRLCAPCRVRLDRRALRPVEWFNLASIHSPWKHLLHDDFYTRSGKAFQPRGEVHREKGLMRAPSLRDCVGDATRMLDYAYTRHILVPETVNALNDLDPQSLLTALGASLSRRTPNDHNSFMACSIAAEVFGPLASHFVRRQLEATRAGNFSGMVRAAAACLPREEAVQWSLAFLDKQDPKRRGELKDSLGSLGAEQVLDWIEGHESEIEDVVSWQRLAAASAFNWERAKRWLWRGRPLSLVALGAMRENMGLLSPPVARPPLSWGLVEEMVTELEAYLERDPAPTPRNQVEEIRAVITAR